MLLPFYAALAAALFFYLAVPVLGGFFLRAQWRRFRLRVAAAFTYPRLRYRDAVLALREGRPEAGRFRLVGTVEALEGQDRVWVRGGGTSALVDLSRAPLYMLAPGEPAAGAIQRRPWASVSSLVEGTGVLVAGKVALEGDKPVFVDSIDEPLIAVCYEGESRALASRLTVSGRSPNEYWNYPTRLSLSLGLAAISAILLLLGGKAFPSVLALVFLAGATPIMPLAPPGLVFFFLYLRFWRRALAAREERDLLRLALRFAAEAPGAEGAYARRELALGEAAPAEATLIARSFPPRGERGIRTLFTPIGAAEGEKFVVEGNPQLRVREADRAAAAYIAAAGLCFCLGIVLNFALAFALWRSTL